MLSRDYYTAEEAARLSPGSYRLFEELLNRGEVPEAYKDGQWMIPAEVYNDLILGRLATPKPEARIGNTVESDSLPKGFSLYAWQREALEHWQRSGHRGVVEAVTGTGKTRLALAAIEDHLRQKGRVLVLVTTKELLTQWKREAQKMLVGARGKKLSFGFLGDGHRDNLLRCDVLFATVQSAAKNHSLLPPGEKGLLIADEVHRYGVEIWSRALDPYFQKRLGLTATYERTDRGLEQFLDPYFGGKVYSLDYHRALADDVIAAFKIAFIGVPFSAAERKDYDKSSKQADKYKRMLTNAYGITEEPFGEFMREVTVLSKSGEEGARLAGFYLSAFTKRRQILAGAVAKYRRLADFAPAVHAADKTILFAQTKEAAAKAADAFAERGVNSAVLNSSMDMSERKEVFAAFEDSEHALVAAPRLLDEGVDVPSADLAVVLASSRSKRQMIQRMGRVVRKKIDRRLARLAILYVEGTSEDPTAAHEDFLYVVTGVAREIRHFTSNASSAEVCEYLNDWSSH